MEEYRLEKMIWTDEDFENMCWHDCRIHAIGLSEEEKKLYFDIDYIFKWVLQENNYYSFWVAPCTLVFDNVTDILFDIENYLVEIEIFDLEKTESKELLDGSTDWNWFFDTQSGEISFWSTGFKQYVRKMPILGEEQKLNYKERGGISLLIPSEFE